MTEEEKQEIIDRAVEKALLLIPETVGNMMANHMAFKKINEEFYKKHPEFRDKKDIVASVVQMVEGKNPLLDYKDILTKSVPEIHKRLNTLKSLDMKGVSSNPSRKFNKIGSSSGTHGAI